MIISEIQHSENIYDILSPSLHRNKIIFTRLRPHFSDSNLPPNWVLALLSVRVIPGSHVGSVSVFFFKFKAVFTDGFLLFLENLRPQNSHYKGKKVLIVVSYVKELFVRPVDAADSAWNHMVGNILYLYMLKLCDQCVHLRCK